MKVCKCDICNKETDYYYTINLRVKIDGNDNASMVDICEKCYTLMIDYLKNKGVKNAS